MCLVLTLSVIQLLILLSIPTVEPACVACVQQVRHPAWKILDQFECGESASDRIIGGVNAALGQFPWIARLGYNDLGDRSTKIDFGCGGSLLTDRHVVTAGHCVADVKLVIIRLGEYDIRTDPDCVNRVCAPPFQERKIKRIMKHPSFNQPRFHFDIAMILLELPVVINNYVLPICLPRGYSYTPMKTGDLATVAGWGKMNMTTEKRANILQTLQISLLKPQSCNTRGPGFKITEAEICAGAELNRDTCAGDSGGPLMMVHDTAEGPKYVLDGVVSFGPTICGNRKPGVYVSVPHFLPWILDSILRLK